MDWNTLATALFGADHGISQEGDVLRGNVRFDGNPLTVIGTTNHAPIGVRLALSQKLYTEAQKLLTEAEKYLDKAPSLHRARWRGYRTHARAQGLAWPRSGASDIEGNSIASDAIPSEVVNACCEAAIAELATPNALSPSFVPAKGIKSASVDGAVAVTYRDGATDANAQRMALTAVDDALATLIGVLPKPALFGESGRA